MTRQQWGYLLAFIVSMSLLLIIATCKLLAEDNRMPQTRTFGGLINCMAVSDSGEIIVATDQGLYSLTRKTMLSVQPVNAIDISGDTIFTISMEPKLQTRDMQGTISSERSLGNMEPDSSRECIYPGLNGHFFLANMGDYPLSGIWRLAGQNIDGPFSLPQEITGRRLRGLGWNDNHFWIANQLEQIIYKLNMNPGMRRLETVNVLPRSLPTSSAILGLTWHDGNLYVAFQVGEETVIHIYEAEAEPRRNERD